ncbi:hemerythrin family protein [Muricomes intestini]|uniref:bacteriohemerythrin n=1 Tax=Muricomes intestini TaxID=1796634 RepID=UPI002FE07957
MKYELTKDLETGNALIDSEHRELFRMVNNLQDACAKGQGRSQVETAAKFLVDYVKKHFRDEQNLQTSVNYPGYPAHKKFHEDYIRQIEGGADKILASNADIASLAELNKLIGILVAHIRTEDRKLASYVSRYNK